MSLQTTDLSPKGCKAILSNPFPVVLPEGGFSVSATVCFNMVDVLFHIQHDFLREFRKAHQFSGINGVYVQPRSFRMNQSYHEIRIN